MGSAPGSWKRKGNGRREKGGCARRPAARRHLRRESFAVHSLSSAPQRQAPTTCPPTPPPSLLGQASPQHSPGGEGGSLSNPRPLPFSLLRHQGRKRRGASTQARAVRAPAPCTPRGGRRADLGGAAAPPTAASPQRPPAAAAALSSSASVRSGPQQRHLRPLGAAAPAAAALRRGRRAAAGRNRRCGSGSSAPHSRDACRMTARTPHIECSPVPVPVRSSPAAGNRGGGRGSRGRGSGEAPPVRRQGFRITRPLPSFLFAHHRWKAPASSATAHSTSRRITLRAGQAVEEEAPRRRSAGAAPRWRRWSVGRPASWRRTWGRGRT
jgi:hypothetical protein